ncbi:MAG: NAD(+)/NADH kinase [Actinomycetales bacterium]
MLNSVGIVLHPDRSPDQAVQQVVAWAKAHELPVYALAEEVARIACDAVPVSADRLAAESSMVISLGGDGTMLRALRLAGPHERPVLGVNFGRLGFLAEVDLDELEDALSAVDSHAFTIESRTAVTCSACDPTLTAFNDVALVRVPGDKVAAVEVVVDGQPFVRYAADAVIISTPTGSTAYAYSAGGPIVSPTVDGLLVIPAAPHSTFNRAIMLSGSEHLELRVLGSSGSLAVEVDGIVSGRAKAGDTLVFRMVRDAGRVVRFGRTTFYERARRKLQVSGSAEAF